MYTMDKFRVPKRFVFTQNKGPSGSRAASFLFQKEAYQQVLAS